MVAEQQAHTANDRRPGPAGLGRLTVSGYKSILEPVTIRIAPLTVLAGANSSGKSSIMQPLLLLKQTLEAPYDPGALLLRGPHVQLTSVEQLFSNCGRMRRVEQMSVQVETDHDELLRTVFERKTSGGLDVVETERSIRDDHHVLRKSMSSDEIALVLPPRLKEMAKSFLLDERAVSAWEVVRSRSFLHASVSDASAFAKSLIQVPDFYSMAESLIRRVLHVPGLRGIPARTYPITSVESSFPGDFTPYTASIIADWQDRDGGFEIYLLNRALQALGLTTQVGAERINDTEVELRVSRTVREPSQHRKDLVSLADVGLGISQALPVLVALLVAMPGQTVYIEQPEIHLHPNAQFKIAELLVEAASRGVRVIVETHSSITLLGVQAAVAEGTIPGQDVALHWFSRDRYGQTHVQSVEMDESGGFGDWPEDFSDIYLQAQERYLDAVEKRQLTN